MSTSLGDNIAKLRQEYSAEPLTKESVHKNPFKQFEIWFKEAMNAEIWNRML